MEGRLAHKAQGLAQWQAVQKAWVADWAVSAFERGNRHVSLPGYGAYEGRCDRGDYHNDSR
jgi:hypothetical protein